MALSPMMQHYIETKEQYSDCILFYRLGDFYEMFFEDAITVSRELELTLTGKDCGLKERAPMCGIPYHALNNYLPRLVEKGYKVAICEQLTDPKDSKGLVLRDVVRTVTPGTLIDEGFLQEDRNNFIAGLCLDNGAVGVAWSDISTGECNYTYFEGQTHAALNDLLSRIEPKEIICNEAMAVESINLSVVRFCKVCPFTLYNESAFDLQNAGAVASEKLPKEVFEKMNEHPVCIKAIGALLSYIEKTQKRSLKHLNQANCEKESQYMIIETAARKTLELTESSDGKRHGSLLWLIDNTSTGMGKRLLRKWIEQPDIDSGLINAKLDSVEELKNKIIVCDEICENLKKIHDIERLTGRLSYGNMTPKDCLALSQSLEIIPKIKDLLKKAESPYLTDINSKLNPLNYEYKLLFDSISENAGNNLKEGNVIKEGYDKELDELREVGTNSKVHLAKLESKEKELTKIKNLKIGFNKVFGYYIEVSNSQKELVPYRYVRRQTVANGERYITEELKILEEKILNSEERSVSREIRLYDEILKELIKSVDDLLAAAKLIGQLDCIVSHALTAYKNNFVKPLISNSLHHIKICEGRHGIVEKLLKNDSFVPNDTLLDDNENRIALITGPNMAGKSVYMRQVALIVIMAHIGCFVPAKSAEISITDRIFTRVGASDDVSTGRSTFMVEMSEVSSILRNVTDKSLLLLDEIGRGTSTYDGLSIAWAIIEYLASNSKAKTLFSTHYHELTELEGSVCGLKNYKLTVKEINNAVVFLRKLMRGSANRSFGIEVASLAGLPDNVVKRAKELLKGLEKNDIARKSQMATNQQLSIFGNTKLTEVKKILQELDLDSVSPRAALDILTDLKEKVELDG